MVSNATDRFSKKCSCSAHVSNSSKLLNIKISKRVKKSNISALINRGYLTERSKYVCESCLYPETSVEPDEERTIDMSQESEELEEEQICRKV